jgi:hypothetical protein
MKRPNFTKMLYDQHHLETHGNAKELQLIACISRLHEIYFKNHGGMKVAFMSIDDVCPLSRNTIFYKCQHL